MTIEARKLFIIQRLMQIEEEAVIQQLETIIQNAESGEMETFDLRDFLLNGPVMDDEEYANYLEVRNWMNEWRA